MSDGGAHPSTSSHAGLHRLIHPRNRRRGRASMLRSIGPGLITGASDDDPSGIGTYSQIGAQFGLAMLWTVPVSLVMASGVEELAARLGLVSGEGLASLIKKNFAAPILYIAALLVTAANTFNVGADLGSMAAALRLVIPIPFTPLLVAITAILLGLEVFVTYRRYSRLLRVLTLSLLAYFAVLLVVHIQWGSVASSLVIPHLRSGKDYLGALVAIFGTTISPYLMFWQCSEEVEERGQRGQTRVSRRRLRSTRIDIAVGMFAAVAGMFAILVAAAFTLGAHGITNIGTADQAAQALTPVAGKFAGVLFALGIVGTGALAVPVLAGSTGYALAETFSWHEGLAKTFRQARGFYVVIIVSMVAGLLMNFIGLDPIKALIYAATLNGLAAPPLILLMLLLGNRRRAVHGYRSGWFSNIVVGAALMLMTALPLLYLVAT